MIHFGIFWGKYLLGKKRKIAWFPSPPSKTLKQKVFFFLNQVQISGLNFSQSLLKRQASCPSFQAVWFLSLSPHCWWWTGKPGVLRLMGSQRVGQDWATELNWTECKFPLKIPHFPLSAPCGFLRVTVLTLSLPQGIRLFTGPFWLEKLLQVCRPIWAARPPWVWEGRWLFPLSPQHHPLLSWQGKSGLDGTAPAEATLGRERRLIHPLPSSPRWWALLLPALRKAQLCRSGGSVLGKRMWILEPTG